MLLLNTLTFTLCFAVWMFNGVMVSYLSDNKIFNFSSVEIGWLLALPVLSGAIFRLPAGILTDKIGGKWMFVGLLFFCAIPMFLMSYANSFMEFALCSVGFGLIGSGFSVGVAYTAVWYPKHWQGRALGIFGAGNAGAGLTTLLAPTLLASLTNDGTNPDNWRLLPQYYSYMMIVLGIIFLLLAKNKINEANKGRTFLQMMKPLKQIRVWRFGLYYYLVFGCFVALAQWLVPYYVNMYGTDLVTAGILASVFSMPSGVIRILGGWMSDKFGARKVMYWIFITSILFCFLLIIPRMEITSPGGGVMSTVNGTVTYVSDSEIHVNDEVYTLEPKAVDGHEFEGGILPSTRSWQYPAVEVGDKVKKKQLLAKGETHIYFEANMWVATVFIFIVGMLWGIGKAAVYKHIPNYFPNDIGAVGGMVGVLGGLGGFFSPIIFGYLLQGTGLWTSMWVFLFFVSLLCLWWMHTVIVKMRDKAAPETAGKFERAHDES